MWSDSESVKHKVRNEPLHFATLQLAAATGSGPSWQRARKPIQVFHAANLDRSSTRRSAHPKSAASSFPYPAPAPYRKPPPQPGAKPSAPNNVRSGIAEPTSHTAFDKLQSVRRGPLGCLRALVGISPGLANGLSRRRRSSELAVDEHACIRDCHIPCELNEHALGKLQLGY